MSDDRSAQSERRARIWAETLEKIRAAYARVGPLVPPAFGEAPSVWVAWARRVLEVSPGTAYRRVRGVRARAWLHPDKFRGVAVALSCPERVGVHFAAELLWFRYSLAVDALEFSDRRLQRVSDWCPHVGGPSSGPNYESWVPWPARRGGAAWGRWRARQATWVRTQLDAVLGQLANPDFLGQRQALQRRRRVLAGFLEGRVWAPGVEPPECADEVREQQQERRRRRREVRQQQRQRQQQERDRREAEARRARAHATAAAAARAAAAAERAAEFARAARRCSPDFLRQLAEAIAWRWRRWKEAQRAVVDPRSPPLVPPPQQRLADPDSPWGQLDHVPVRDLAVCRFRTYESVPRDLRARVAKALGDVLRRLFAFPADLLDPQCTTKSARERSRALKWLLGFWQLFLRRVTSNRGRRRRPLERRLTQWENRDFAALVAEWRTDCDNQPAPKPRGERGLESQVDSAVALIEEGQISRGVRFLHSAAQGLGVAGLDEEGVLEQLRLKHPRRRTPVRSFSYYGVPRSGPLDMDDVVVRKGRKLRRRVGVGADGGRNEHIRAVLACHGDMDADSTGDLLSQFASEWAGGVLPRWYYAHSLAARLVALEKRKVGRRELKPVRPIGVGSAVHRLVASAVVEHAKAVFLRLLAPIQVAVNVKSAADKLVFGLRALQQQHAAEAGLRKIDIVNAFNEFDRHRVIELIADKRQYLSQVAAWGAAQVAELQALLPVVWAMLSVAPELVGEGGAGIAIRSWSGGVQGNPLLPALFCVGLHPALHSAQLRLKEHADWAVVRAQMDDAYLLGPVDVLDEVEGELRRALRGAGMRVDDGKWLTWAAPDVRRRVVAEREEAGLPPWAWGAALVKDGERRFATAGGQDGELQEGGWRVCGYGLHIQGVPVGERPFVDGEVRRLVCVAEKKVTLVRDVLVHSKYRHHLHTANVYCFAPLLDHLLRSSFPDDVIGPFARFDAVIKSTAQLALGLQLSDSLVCERSRLPPRRGGLLLRERGGSRAFLPHVAFWSGAASALSAFADRHNDAGALTQAGFLPELAAFVGPDSFGGGCDVPFRRVLQSGGRLGDSLLRSWQRLQVLARVAEVDGYVGLLAADAASVAYAERHLQAS